MNLFIFTGYSGFSRRTNSFAKLIKEKYSNIDIDVVTFGLENFNYLKSQPDLYRSTSCADHLRLECLKNEYEPLHDAKYWEEKLDVNLSRIALSERLFVQHSHDLIYLKRLSHEEIIIHVLSLLEIYEKLIKNTDIIYVYTAASIESEIIYLFSKYYNKKFYCYYECRLGYNFVLSDNTMDQHNELAKIYSSIGNNCIIENSLYKSFINQIQKSEKTEHQEQYLYTLQNVKKFSPPNFIRFIKNIIRDKYVHYLSPSRKQRVLINLLLRIRNKYSKKYFTDVLPSSNYVYFPLPTVPEASTLIRSPDYYDCLSLIKSLSIEIPLDWKLVVKEHPGMLGVRPLGFYNRISKIYNVECIVPNYSTKEIINNAEAVITQTGTSSIESIGFGIKTITLGSTITNIIKGVFSLTHVSEVGDALRSPWTAEDSSNLINELKKFALAVEKYGYVPDNETVLWTPKAFNPDIIDLDRLYFEDFDYKVLSKLAN